MLTAFSGQLIGQSMLDVFKQFDFEVTFPCVITKEVKDSLIENGTYIVPGGDDEDAQRLSFSIDENSLSLTCDYTTGQNGFYNISLGRFLKDDGSLLIGYSKHGGSKVAVDHHELKFYSHSGGVFSIDSTIKLPSQINVADFLKSDAPDSTVKRVENCTSTWVNFEFYTNQWVSYVLYKESGDISKWRTQFDIRYLWNGNSFVLDRGFAAPVKRFEKSLVNGDSVPTVFIDTRDIVGFHTDNYSPFDCMAASTSSDFLFLIGGGGEDDANYLFVLELYENSFILKNKFSLENSQYNFEWVELYGDSIIVGSSSLLKRAYLFDIDKYNSKPERISYRKKRKIFAGKRNELEYIPDEPTTVQTKNFTVVEGGKTDWKFKYYIKD